MTARQSIQIEKETRGIPSMLAGNVDELAQHVASAVRAEVDFYKSTRAMADDDLLASCTENIRFALKSLEGGVAFDTLPAASTGSDGVDVADSQARKAALREGQIWAFFATKERAEKFTAARHGPHRQFGRCIIAGGEGAGTRPHTSDEGTELSETKVTVIYDNPVDAGAFESAYESEQLEAARRIPGYLRFEASKVWPKEDGTPTPAYRMLDLYYPDYDAAVAAVTTPEAGAFFEAMARLSTGGVRVLVSDIEVTKG